MDRSERVIFFNITIVGLVDEEGSLEEEMIQMVFILLEEVIGG